MNNCLVTKMKGTVDNNNLPIYNKLYASANPVIVGGVSAFNFHIGAVNSPIHLKSKVKFTPYGTTTKITEYTINPGSDMYGTIEKSDIVSDSELTDLLEIDNFYNCNLFLLTWGAWLALNMPIELRDNYESMLKYAPLEIISLNKDDINDNIPESVYYVVVESEGFGSPYLDGDNLFNLPNIEAIAGYARNKDGSPNGDIWFKGNKNYNNSNLIYLQACFDGDIANLPYGLKWVNVAGLVGNIEDFVTMAIAKGRTADALALRGARLFGEVKYGGTRLITLINNHNIPTVGTNDACFTWDAAGNIAFVDTFPEGYQLLYPSDYYVRKHSQS